LFRSGLTLAGCNTARGLATWGQESDKGKPEDFPPVIMYLVVLLMQEAGPRIKQLV
jgi:hypothetical protein